MFKNKRIRYISVEEMNNNLDYCNKYRKIQFNAKPEKEYIGLNAYLEVKLTKVELTYRICDQVTTWITRLDSNELGTQQIRGIEAFRILCKWYKFPRIDYMDDISFSAAPIVNFNPKYEGQWMKGYYYDLNSAYASVMVSGIFPDTSKAPRKGYVKEDEIGFDVNYKTNKAEIIKTGEYAEWIFPKIEIPEVADFAKHWYEIKKNPKNAKEKAKAKNILNFCVGYLQNYNPFIRTYIVCKCNERMEEIMNKYPDDWCICNTDAIISRIPLDLDMGDNIGQFKYEENDFAYVGCNYQFGKELKYRGIPKSWFPEGWDIVKDEIPHHGNIYEFDYINTKIVEVNYEQKEIY